MSLLARLSLAHRGLIALIAVVVTGFGAFAIPRLKQQLLPSLEIPGAFITASYPGADPDMVEARVVEPIEDAVEGVPGVDSVTSIVQEGFATVEVAFDYGTAIDDAIDELHAAIDRVDAQLPDAVELQVLAGSTDDLPALVLAASGGDDVQQLADRLRTRVIPELEKIEGVRDAQLTGARDSQIVITPNPAKLAAARIDPTAIRTALTTNGVAVPAGAIVDGDRALPVQVGSSISSLDELRALPVGTTRKGALIRLGDVATVEEQLTPPTSFTRTNGAESLGISVIARPDGNAVAISRDVRERLGELSAAAGVSLTVVFDQAPFVERSIKSLTTEGLLGLVMAVVVILVFLLSVRSTVVTAVSIPLSVVVALIVLWIGDHSLNLLTLGGLTIAVGRVVDDSIVVLENIKRHLSYGEPRRTAILTAVREVAGAVTASTLTTVAVFAPIALVGGLVGELFAPFAITVTVALLASLVVSLTVIPVLAYWFLKPAGDGRSAAEVRQAAQEKELRSPLQRAYLPVVRFATTKRWTTVLIGLVVLVGTFGLATRLETNFLDESGQDTLNIRQVMPAGTSLTVTDAAARKVEEVLARTEGVRTYQVTVGGGEFLGMGSGSPTVATFMVALEPDVDAASVRDELRAEFSRLTGVGQLTVGGGAEVMGANRIHVVIQGADEEALARAAEQVREAMASVPDLVDVESNLAERVPRVQVRVNRDAAARYGLSEAQIGQLVAQSFRGVPVGQVRLSGEPHDVVVSSGAPPVTAEQLRALRVGPVRLADVAEIVETESPARVIRVDGERSVTISGTATSRDLGRTTARLEERLAALSLPEGTRYRIAGVSADQEEAFADLGLAVLAAIAIVYLIMVATFRSLVQPLLLLVSIPFAATGAIGLLLATGTPLGVPALIGVLMLVGIVVTNAIVLMDLINQYRRRGMGIQEAVIEGGRHRLRPILMTAVATVCALLPMAFGLTGDGGFIARPLALVVIGGLASSTLLTLVLVPALYTLVEGAAQRLRHRARAEERGERAPSPARPAEDAAATATGDGAAPPSGAPDQGSASAAAPSTALVEATDQFEVLRLPRTRSSGDRATESDR